MKIHGPPECEFIFFIIKNNKMAKIKKRIDKCKETIFSKTKLIK